MTLSSPLAFDEDMLSQWAQADYRDSERQTTADKGTPWETGRQKETGADRDKRKHTETDGVRQRQTETDRGR